MDGTTRDYRVDDRHVDVSGNLAEGAAYHRIWELTRVSDYDPDMVATVISRHAKIAERLLRVTNSLTAGIKREVTSVRHAVLMIGSRGVAEFARPFAERVERQQQAEAAVPPDRNIRIDSAQLANPTKTPIQAAVGAVMDDPRR